MDDRDEVNWADAAVNVLLSVIAVMFDSVASALLGRRKPPTK
ncbi:MAG: hypothetical protein O7H41_11385 [Planctomycetota bacterium]|nr:hypothetical protein [Planctomycetota bacterium]